MKSITNLSHPNVLTDKKDQNKIIYIKQNV